MHRSVTSGPDPWTGANGDDPVLGGSASGPQWHDPGRPGPQQRDPQQRSSQRPGAQWRDPQRPAPEWRDPQRTGPQPRDPQRTGPQPRDPQQRGPQRPGPREPDPQRTGPRQRDAQRPSPQRPAPQPRDADWGDPQRTGPQPRDPGRSGLGWRDRQRRDADWRDPQRTGPQPRDPQRPGPYGRDPGRTGPQQRDPQLRDRQRPAPDWRGAQQRGQQPRGAQRPGPDWRGAQQQGAQRPGPDWRGVQQRDPNGRGPQRPGQDWGGTQRTAPDWDGPQQRDPEWSGPQQRDPGWGGPQRPRPDWRGPGRGGPGSHGRRPGGPRRRGRKRTPLRHRRWAQITAALLAVFLITVSWSVGNALTVPGGGPLSTRLAEWARDHYLGPVVTFGEWLTYQPPKVGGKPSFSLSGEGIAAAKERARKLRGRQAALAALYAPPLPLKSLAGKPLPGEGQWRVLSLVGGKPAVFGTRLRVSAVYSSYAAGIAVLNQNLVRFQLRPGTEDPGSGNWKALPDIPPGTRTGLLATFNSGFKIASSGGGFYLNGLTSGTLTNGVASVVYYRNGRMSIGVWGQTVHMTPDVVGVRQNLHLIVVNGQIPQSVDSNVESSWGATLGGGYYVWRSGIGETRDGRIVFAYGPALNVREIAELLQRAGAVNAMQLDINPEWMSFMYYLPMRHPADPTPFNLLPTQNQSSDRYFSISGRDFTAVYAR